MFHCMTGIFLLNALRVWPLYTTIFLRDICCLSLICILYLYYIYSSLPWTLFPPPLPGTKLVYHTYVMYP